MARGGWAIKTSSGDQRVERLISLLAVFHRKMNYVYDSNIQEDDRRKFY